MKKIFTFLTLLAYCVVYCQMTEIASTRKPIGYAKSLLSKRDITLEHSENYYVLYFLDCSYKYSDVHESIILNETESTLKSFEKSVSDSFDKPEITEKIFKSGNYKITANYFGKVPDRHVALFFQKENATKVVITPFLGLLDWYTLFNIPQ